MENKPDFKELALFNASLQCEPVYAAGCEKVWTDYVTPLQSQLKESQSQNERLLSALKETLDYVYGADPELYEKAKQLINSLEKQ